MANEELCLVSIPFQRTKARTQEKPESQHTCGLAHFGAETEDQNKTQRDGDPAQERWLGYLSSKSCDSYGASGNALSCCYCVCDTRTRRKAALIIQAVIWNARSGDQAELLIPQPASSCFTIKSLGFKKMRPESKLGESLDCLAKGSSKFNSAYYA
jgi:hypothetical protein